MLVYKFGGASVRDAAGIRNLALILSGIDDQLVVVVSAFGKTTNALELVHKRWMAGDPGYTEQLDSVHSYHREIFEDLNGRRERAENQYDKSFDELKSYLKNKKPAGFDFEYDQIVSYGELWSTLIISQFLNQEGSVNKWIDIRSVLLTDNRHRDANIIWDESSENIKKTFDFAYCRTFITQGFIGGTSDGHASTLGREGSDYTAAVLANVLDAESVTVWKDVPGLLNADPKWMSDAVKLDEVSYREAVEMTFSGAKVIHPKTIKPLHNKSIPLHVRSFIDPSLTGTLVTSEPEIRKVHPVYIRKEKQVLLTLLPKDFSFVMGDNLSNIFRVFMNQGIKVNLVEASAVSIDVCIDDERSRIEELIAGLKSEYSVLYNEGVEMLTVRHYTAESVERITKSREVLLEQRTRSTVRFVVRGLSVK
jgi:aspartate kinase